VGRADGADCGSGSICLQQACVSSRCGDGYVDTATGEDCEDGNATAGDGCFNCRFECRANPDCDDKDPCNGAETCDQSVATRRMCRAGTPPGPGIACTPEAGGTGSCANGTCIRAGCGNSVVEAGEECDDGNADDADGCTRACLFTCKADLECADRDLCNGNETCNLANHRCSAGTAVACPPGMGCQGACVPRTGTCAYPDVDRDGVSCQTDCNDADPAVFPGGFECSDGKDNDCNPATLDVGAAGCLCYVDADTDGYAANTTNSISSGGACPAGYTRRAPVGIANIDCGPGAASAHPGQTDYFPMGYCPSVLCAIGQISFDYNCDRLEEPIDGTMAAATCVGPVRNEASCLNRSGWVGAVPACGKPGTYRQCRFAAGTCSGVDILNRVQACR
jgi:cysteine-rich repeat protein